MEEMSKHGRIGDAAMKAGMHRQTARKYVAAGELPSMMATPRDWRTRPDPFEEHWPAIEARLRSTPELEAKTLFEVLQEDHPDRYEAGQLRTLQRRVKQWRAAHGPDREVVIAQRHRPGEAAQTDFTSTSELAVTIAGQVFAHLLCVLVLPYSNRVIPIHGHRLRTVAINQPAPKAPAVPQTTCSLTANCASPARRLLTADVFRGDLTVESGPR